MPTEGWNVISSEGHQKSVSIGTRDRVFLPKTSPVLRTLVYQTLHERSWRRPLFHYHSLCYSSCWVSLSFHHSHFCIFFLSNTTLFWTPPFYQLRFLQGTEKNSLKHLKERKKRRDIYCFWDYFSRAEMYLHTVPETRSPKPRWQKANYFLVSSSSWWLQALLDLWGHPSNLSLHIKWSSSWPVSLYVLLSLIRTLNGFRIHPHAIRAHLHLYLNYICKNPLCKPVSGWTCILGRGTYSTHHSYRASSRQETPSVPVYSAGSLAFLWGHSCPSQAPHGS